MTQLLEPSDVQPGIQVEQAKQPVPGPWLIKPAVGEDKSLGAKIKTNTTFPVHFLVTASRRNCSVETVKFWNIITVRVGGKGYVIAGFSVRAPVWNEQPLLRALPFSKLPA